MKNIIIILLLFFCTIQIDAQVTVTNPDSLTTYNNSIRENNGGKVGDPVNSNLRAITPNKKKENRNSKGNKTVIFDPLDPTKNVLILKTVPKK